MGAEVQSQSLLSEVLDEIRARRSEFEAQKYVPRDMVEKLKKLGIYRAATPKRFGGEQMPPAKFLALIEKISEADGSTGWVASFGSASMYLAALPLDTLAEVYAKGPDLVFAGGLFPVQQAERVEGGWRVNGVWKFVSGCMAAELFGVGIGVGAEGKPLVAAFRPEQGEIIENWDVLGLRATGSHDLKVTNLFVPDEWTFVRGGKPSVDEPLYQYPSIAYAAQVLAVVNLGVARAALDELTRMAEAQAGYTGAPRMADRAYLRIDLAKAEGALRSARAFFYEITESVWESIMRGDGVNPKQVNLLRLAAVEATRVGAYAVQTAYRLGGIAAIYDNHPLQLYLRDAMVVTQHAFMSEGLYDAAGSIFTGLPPYRGYI